MNPDYVLDDNEKQALIAFNSSETMKQAVKKVLLAGLYENGTLQAGQEAHPRRNAAFWMVANMPMANDDEIGRELRSLWQGIQAVEVAFDKISTFLTPQKVEDKPNPAR